MDKKYFEAVNNYGAATEKLYSSLEELGLETKELDVLFEEVNSLYDKYLKVGKEFREDRYVGEEVALNKSYEGLPSYLRLEIVYTYDNGYSLCASTDMEYYLIPNEYLGSN